MTWQDVVALATELPGVEESIWWRSPALKVDDKGFARLRREARGRARAGLRDGGERGAAGLRRSRLLHTPHYDGCAYILVDLDRVASDRLREMLDAAWWLTAPAKARTLRERGRG
ncbi:MmcQ/YjbR family DNA-binding protein [Nocardia sp. NBC_01730]|uniref:MmcQ/YjbR family DNA-binding protein n=1 Tax=Nocardia sp. NBC_01730 TaxID=2975998 RepID=UPI002E10E51A